MHNTQALRDQRDTERSRLEEKHKAQSEELRGKVSSSVLLQAFISSFGLLSSDLPMISLARASGEIAPGGGAEIARRAERGQELMSPSSPHIISLAAPHTFPHRP